MTKTIVVAADINGKIAIKYVYAELSSHPNPSYDISTIHINKGSFKEKPWRASVRPFPKCFKREKGAAFINGGVKVPASTGRSWRNDTGDSGV